MDELRVPSRGWTSSRPSPDPRPRRNCRPNKRHRGLSHQRAAASKTSPLDWSTTATVFDPDTPPRPLAAQIGAQVLGRGGSAADAAVPSAAALNVTEPTSTGIGGDCFALYYDAASRQMSALNGSGRAPAALRPGRIR